MSVAWHLCSVSGTLREAGRTVEVFKESPRVRSAGMGPALMRLAGGWEAPGLGQLPRARSVPLTAPLVPSSHLCAQGFPGKLPPGHHWALGLACSRKGLGLWEPTRRRAAGPSGWGPEGGADASPVNLGPPCLSWFSVSAVAPGGDSAHHDLVGPCSALPSVLSCPSAGRWASFTQGLWLQNQIK